MARIRWICIYDLHMIARSTEEFDLNTGGEHRIDAGMGMAMFICVFQAEGIDKGVTAMLF